MRIHYKAPADIVAELLTLEPFDGGGNPIEFIVLTDKEMKRFQEQLTKDWNGKSEINCYDIHEDDDPYQGRDTYYKWNGRYNMYDEKGNWVLNCQILTEAEFKEIANKRDLLSYAKRQG